MYYKKRIRLIAYADGMLHSCLKGKQPSHIIAECPDRKEVLAKLIKKYEAGNWQLPDEFISVINNSGTKERGYLGALPYVKKNTRN